ncbi:type IV pilus secretin PilQ [Dyella sp. A6]|uniref:type IV pilus secretin PilQ n=1 Tax=Dyella aluminiiresistens TaxID=3069105 RepID=UPI002E78248E|nr:type IV pilus secretin PilQ [Dyella sp. A6]
MRLASRCLMLALLIGGTVWATDAAATTTLKDIHAETLPGGRVALHLDFAGGPVPQPRIFTTDNPPRIAVDFANTVNGAARHTDLNVGATTGVTAVSAGGRTRVLVDLIRSSTYETKVEGDSLVLTVDNGSAIQPAAAAATIDPSKVLPSATNGPLVSNIDFRRGVNGSGRVLISFAGPGAHANMHREGDKVLVDLEHVRLPASDAQRLDVLDFATPVEYISTRATPGGARMEISFRGSVDTSSYQTGNQYVVEISPKKVDAKAEAIANGSQHHVYTGNRVTFNFQNIPVRSALQLLADVSGLNLVASDSVGGSVTLRLVNVPWDQALDVILRAKGLDKRRDGNVIWIAPQKEIASYEESVAQARIKEEDSAPLITSYIPISYGKAKDIAKLLTTGSMQSGGGGGSSGNNSHGFLSPRGSVSYDNRTNTLLLNDTAAKTAEIRKLVAELDKPVQQVLIESRIVIATDSFERDLGVKWGINGQQTNPSGQVLQIGGPLTSATTTGTGTASIASPSGFNVNLPSTTTGGALGLAILGKNYALDLELSAAQTEGRGEVISSPRVITANQQEADIRQGQEIGYVTYQSGSASAGGVPTASVQFKDAVLELKVTPTITADNRIYLSINVKKDALNKFITTPNGQVPLIDTRSVNTSALVDNGQTVVLGGIYEITKNDSIVKVPGLGDIPILGSLFRQTSRTNSKAELLIFVTPRILSDNLQ